MTNEEIKLRIIRKLPDDFLKDEGNRTALSLMGEALEKQIPKKIDTDQERCFCCKLCGFKLQDLYWNEEDYEDFKDSLQYCPHCGQRINWKEN